MDDTSRLTQGEREEHLKQYGIIADFHHVEASIFWQRHTIFIAMNTALAAVLALAKPEGGPNASNAVLFGTLPALLFLKLVLLVSILVCFAWLVITISGAQWVYLYARLMRDIECKLSLPAELMRKALPAGARCAWLRKAVGVRMWSAVAPVVFLGAWSYMLCVVSPAFFWLAVAIAVALVALACAVGVVSTVKSSNGIV